MFENRKERNSSFVKPEASAESPNRKCPVTGLAVRARAEWTNIDFGSEFFLTIMTVGRRILLCESLGKAGAADFLESKERIGKVAREVFGNSPYVQIEDFSKLRNQESKAIERYIGETAGRKNLLALIAYGLPFHSRLGFRLKKRLRPPEFDLILCKNYPDAVNAARRLLSSGDSKRKNPKGKQGSSPEFFSKEDWRLDFGNFDIQFQIIDFEIIYSVSHGFLKTEHLPAISDLRKKVARTLLQIGNLNYFIVDMEAVTGLSPNIRRKYLESIQDFYRKYPFRKLYFRSGNKLLNTASNLVKLFLDFELSAVRDLEHALALVSKDRSKSAISPARTEFKPNISGVKTGNEKYAQDILVFLGRIDWEKEGMPPNSEIPASHPYREIFDAVRLIKLEVDSLWEEKRQREKHLTRTAERANMAKNEFLSNISHELFTPLHAVVNFSRFGIDKMESATPEQLLAYFREINEQGLRLTDLLEELLQLREFESGKPQFRFERNDLGEIVDAAVRGFLPKIREKEMRIEILPPTLPLSVECDRKAMETVIGNLIENAVEYGFPNGEIKVSFDKGELETGSGPVKAAMIHVSDNGAGVPENELESIFQKFVQGDSTKTGAGGKGLGLAICKEIVAAHEGLVWAEKNPEKPGAVFVVSIPLNRG